LSARLIGPLVIVLLLAGILIIVPDFRAFPFSSGRSPSPSATSFAACLSGDQEVPANDSTALGRATFDLSSDGSELHYKLSVADLMDSTEAHIHQGAVGENGPVVVWLYPSAPPAKLMPGRLSGMLAEGTIKAENLIGPLAGKPLSALIDAMRSGNTYANVHTSTYPDGEIRGQIKPAG